MYQESQENKLNKINKITTTETYPLLSKRLDSKLNTIICIFILFAIIATFILIIIKN